eukprot:6744712-Heterocapsa_arctica.AAC.1
MLSSPTQPSGRGRTEPIKLLPPLTNTFFKFPRQLMTAQGATTQFFTTISRLLATISMPLYDEFGK